jgi:N-acetylglucosaminyldiphosphoundecaprenol N-acetyl-beta-D-mannosaminyltransferase
LSPHSSSLPSRTRVLGELPSFSILGVPVHAVQIADVVRVMRDWIVRRESCQVVAVTGMHGVTEAQRDPEFKNVLREASLVVPDGMPLVWVGRREGFHLRRRVYGPELMETFCRDTGDELRHFFYGGALGVAERLAGILRNRYGISVAGTFSPPFRPLTANEDAVIVQRINASQPDVIWVGLSTPKQERWMHGHRSLLDVPVTVGVGAAFDYVSGAKRSAPAWMQEHGLEWFYRLTSEPKRLWRRYLLGGSQFVYWLALERLRLRDFG